MAPDDTPKQLDPDDDFIGPGAPAGTWGASMTGGALRAKGYTDQRLQEAWEEACGPQPEGTPRLHEDEEWANTRAGWERRARMFNELMAELGRG